jgi:acetyl-CoA C-acetyltransferase
LEVFLKDIPAPRLGAIAIKAAVERAGIKPDQVDELLMGCVIQANLDRLPQDRRLNMPVCPIK